MAAPIIQIENLGKRFTLRHRQERGRGLRHVLNDAWKAPFRAWRPSRQEAGEPGARTGREEFWALQAVSFTVKPGEAVGIIGRNGAGKSTLLKILSRITLPTTGRVRLRGRVSSLLEVGTGFHPELTGRENIFLNGAVLGMTRAEIRGKFDEIVAFAEVERFLDTPVKRYSSGMYMRLAFAVAAHLEPEILIVDEVLAVGDASFQQKCLGKMSEAAGRHGRTVLFVSHNLAAVQRLCTQCKLLEGGRLVEEGSPARVVQAYLQRCAQALSEDVVLARESDCEVRLRVIDAEGRLARTWRYGRPLEIEVSIVMQRPLWRPAVDLAFYDDQRTRLFALQSDRLSPAPERLEGCWRACFQLVHPELTLPGLSVDVGVREGSGQYFALLKDATRLTLDETSVPPEAASDGLLHPQVSHQWKRGER